MSAARETTVKVNGRPCRVWEKGSGEPLGFLAGFGGLPGWPPILDLLAERRRVIAPSLPGHPGAEGHDLLDSQLDWVLATEELLSGAGLAGADLVGVSVGGALAAEVAAVWRERVKRLVLVAPFGLFDEAEPVRDLFALPPRGLPGVVCKHPEKYEALCAVPEGEDEAEWQIALVRAGEAAARLLWPLGDTQLSKRLPRITQPTLLLWGEEDGVIPPSYAERFAGAISGETEVRLIPDAGHLADVDAPEQVARAVLEFLA
jgi:pimeloyl-ACP methyl ester carboxylesterase